MGRLEPDTQIPVRMKEEGILKQSPQSVQGSIFMGSKSILDPGFLADACGGTREKDLKKLSQILVNQIFC